MGFYDRLEKISGAIDDWWEWDVMWHLGMPSRVLITLGEILKSRRLGTLGTILCDIERSKENINYFLHGEGGDINEWTIKVLPEFHKDWVVSQVFRSYAEMANSIALWNKYKYWWMPRKKFYGLEVK